MSWIWVPVQAYKRWIWLNKDYVQSLNSLANGLTWLLPERFSDSEIGPEAVAALLGIITMFNQHIIENTSTLQHEAPPEIKSFPYSLCISAVKELETLVEVAAVHFYGDEKKWNFLASTEAIKVVLRLAMLHTSGYRMILNGEESSTPEEEKLPSINKGNALKAFDQFGASARMAMDETMIRRFRHQQALIDPTEHRKCCKSSSEKGVSGVFIAGEVLSIARPLIYVLLIRKFGPRKWAPWVVSLVIDLIGVGFLTKLSTAKLLGKYRGLHLLESERNELRRRRLLWVLYLMRDPFFSIFTRQKLQSSEKKLEPVPGVGVLVGKIVDLAIGAQSRYTYISGS